MHDNDDMKDILNQIDPTEVDDILIRLDEDTVSRVHRLEALMDDLRATRREYEKVTKRLEAEHELVMLDVADQVEAAHSDIANDDDDICGVKLCQYGNDIVAVRLRKSEEAEKISALPEALRRILDRLIDGENRNTNGGGVC